jgi:hypothetical protein
MSLFHPFRRERSVKTSRLTSEDGTKANRPATSRDTSPGHEKCLLRRNIDTEIQLEGGSRYVFLIDLNRNVRFGPWLTKLSGRELPGDLLFSVDV